MKVLIANRGEVVARVARTLKRMGIRTVGLYTEADKTLPYLETVDEADLISGDSLSQTYLNREAIVEMAKKSGATAIHPGYGFLSEDAQFASLCEKAGLLWIGPRSDLIRRMADKAESKALCEALNIPTLSKMTLKEGDSFNSTFNFPILVKSPFGGGGKGMQIFDSQAAFEKSRPTCVDHFKKTFGAGDILIEPYIEGGRHIEIQVVCDQKGHVATFAPRDCSTQRRFQKMIEETPAPNLSKDLEERLRQAAETLVKSLHYDSIGTVEFLFTPKGEFFFLEMNTRLQVEHGVTELLYDIDLVELQVVAALGQAIDRQFSPNSRYALQCRLYAEDENFLPAPGKLSRLFLPQWPEVRLEWTYPEGSEVGPFYDPMIGKILFCEESRERAIEKAVSYLKASVFSPLKTNQLALIAILESVAFREGRVSTDWLERELTALSQTFPKIKAPLQEAQRARVELKQAIECAADEVVVVSPITGHLKVFEVSVGQDVGVLDSVAVIESMKMSHAVPARVSGKIKSLLATPGQLIERGAGLMVIKK